MWQLRRKRSTFNVTQWLYGALCTEPRKRYKQGSGITVRGLVSSLVRSSTHGGRYPYFGSAVAHTEVVFTAEPKNKERYAGGTKNKETATLCRRKAWWLRCAGADWSTPQTKWNSLWTWRCQRCERNIRLQYFQRCGREGKKDEERRGHSQSMAIQRNMQKKYAAHNERNVAATKDAQT